MENRNKGGNLSVSSSEALTTTLRNAIQALGRGFDVTSDVRLLYCKGAPGSRFVCIEEGQNRDLELSDGYLLPNVPADIDCSRGRTSLQRIPVCTFPQMAEFFNERSGVKGNIPLGCFNAMFNYTGSWQVDAASTKSLALVGYFIPLYEVKLAKLKLVLRNEIRRAVPSSWDPASLASFIENYGTHIVTSVMIGGRDVVCIRQHQSSPFPVSEIENYVNDMTEHRYHFEEESQSIAGPLKYKDKDIAVIYRRRGGDDLEQSLARWADTVPAAPDIINMTFTPIVSLLQDVPGLRHLTRAIDLYLEYKPPIEDLQYFLDFQIARAWAPEQSNLQRKEPVCSFLQFSLMGPKLFISADQVTVGRKPVTGLRLSLEGSKQNRLSIHLQHLVSLPKILQPHWDSHVPIGAPKWQGPEEQDSRWFEPIKWKNFSHVSTSPIEHTETHIGDLSGVHIVTGAQLGVWSFGSKNVLHLKLLFSKVPGCTIRRSVWDHTPVTSTGRLEPGGPSTSSSTEEKKDDVSGQSAKLVKIVDSTEMLKGPQDLPGHWLVTGAKLGVEKGDEDQFPPGDPVTVSTLLIDAGTKIMQRRLPVKQMNTHVSTFAIYGGDMSRQIETHHYIHRVNDEFLQCAVFASDRSDAPLIVIEYVISDRLYENLPQHEQKLWHSHAYEVKSGSWAYPRLPEVLAAPELKNIAKTYGKFWCTWQIDRDDKLPMGTPELMMSPQGVGQGVLKPELVKRRDEKYNISTDELKHGRAEIAEPEWINPMADYWKQHDKCFVLDIVTVDMNRNEQFP